eukprot:3675905-Amphidinium_carterae.1
MEGEQAAEQAKLMALPCYLLAQACRDDALLSKQQSKQSSWACAVHGAVDEAAERSQYAAVCTDPADTTKKRTFTRRFKKMPQAQQAI